MRYRKGPASMSEVQGFHRKGLGFSYFSCGSSGSHQGVERPECQAWTLNILMANCDLLFADHHCSDSEHNAGLALAACPCGQQITCKS